MAWTFYHLGTDQAPVFCDDIGAIAGDGNWFENLDDAVAAADRELTKDINILRRSREALRRGDFISRKGDLK